MNINIFHSGMSPLDPNCWVETKHSFVTNTPNTIPTMHFRKSAPWELALETSHGKKMCCKNWFVCDYCSHADITSPTTSTGSNFKPAYFASSHIHLKCNVVQCFNGAIWHQKKAGNQSHQLNKKQRYTQKEKKKTNMSVNG